MHFGIHSIGNTWRAAAVAALTALAAASLSAQTTVTGTVKDAAGGAAIAGAIVTLLSNPATTTTTGADGAFSLTIQPPTGLRGAAAGEAIAFNGSEIAFSLSAAAEVRVEIFDLRGQSVRGASSLRLPAGRHAVTVPSRGLAAGVYLVRARAGKAVREFKLSTAGAVARGGNVSMTSAPRLAKAAAAAEFLVVTKDGYLKKHHMLAAMDQPQNITLTASAKATGNMKIFSDEAVSEIEWANAAIYVWEFTATLQTDSTSNAGHKGSKSVINVATAEGFTWNGWAFHVAKQDNETQPTADLSHYKGGSLHLAVKGTMPTLGVMMSSVNQGQGSAPLVDLAGKGYLPDGQWHEITIPLSEFDAGNLDLSQIFVYCGFVAPNTQGGNFDPLATYSVDDIWFVPAP